MKKMKMKKFVLIVLCIKSAFLFGQHTGTFYYTSLGLTTNEESAKTKLEISKNAEDTYKEFEYRKFDNKWNEPNYYTLYTFENDSIINIQSYINNKLDRTTKRIYKRINDSLLYYADYSKYSILEQVGTTYSILPLLLQGKVVNYYITGNKSYEAVYDHNQLISNLRWKENGEKDIDNVFEFFQVEKEPIFKGRNITEFVGRHLNYPLEAMKKNIQGRVIIQFVIREDGSLTHFNVVKSISPILDDEAIRVIRLTSKRWTPGFINNKPVKVEFTMPVMFKLE